MLKEIQSTARARRIAGRCVAAAALCAAAGSSFAATQTITYNDFSSVAGLQLNGSAARVGTELHLTPADYFVGGSAFSSSAISLTADASFSTAFSFVIRDRGGLGNGADGLTFTVQTISNSVGGVGGGLGYDGIGSSVAVEFDTYDNGEFGGSNHVGIDLNGSVNSVVSTPELAPDFDNAQVWHAWVDYNGATNLLEARWSDSVTRPVAAGLSYTTDLPSVLGKTDVYVGFTAATGSGYGQHDILSWQFVNAYDPIPTVPEPGTWALLFAGLGVLGIAKARASRR